MTDIPLDPFFLIVWVGVIGIGGTVMIAGLVATFTSIFKLLKKGHLFE